MTIQEPETNRRVRHCWHCEYNTWQTGVIVGASIYWTCEKCSSSSVTRRKYALGKTQIDQSGLFRCCVDTVETLPDGDYPDGVVIDCKHGQTGNANITLRGGVWQWNNA